MYHVRSLIEKWMDEKLIEGVYVMGKDYLEENLDDYSNWACDPRVINRKDKDIVELIFKVKTMASAYQLYVNQKEICTNNSIRITKKSTDMEYVQRVGFLTGPYVQLASPEEYVKEINSIANIDPGCIEIKKHVTHEKGVGSKVFMIYAIQSEAKEIDQKLFNAQFKRFKYASYKLSDSDQRLALMYKNDIINTKARFETLYNIKVSQVVYQGDKKTTLAEVILKASHGDEKLFLVLEQGSGKFKEHTNVVLNPKLKNRARQWLLTEYPLLTLPDCAPAKTSVVAESSQNKEKYDEDLKEFLSPSLSKVDVSKTKKYSTKLKSYAQALGIEIKHAEKSKEKGKNTKPVVQKNHHNEIQRSLQNQIKSLEMQLQMMSDLIKNICTIIMTDSDKKSQILLSLKDIQN